MRADNFCTVYNETEGDTTYILPRRSERSLTLPGGGAPGDAGVLPHTSLSFNKKGIGERGWGGGLSRIRYCTVLTRSCQKELTLAGGGGPGEAGVLPQLSLPHSLSVGTASLS